MKTTLNEIRNNPIEKPCKTGWNKLLASLNKTKPDNNPLSLLTIYNSNGMMDAVWVLHVLGKNSRELRLFAIWCAKYVQNFMADPRSLAALDVAQRYAEGKISDTDSELLEARTSSEAAWDAAYDEWDEVLELKGEECEEWAARERTWAARAARATLNDSAEMAVRAVLGAAKEASWASFDEMGEIQELEFVRLITCLDTDKRYEI